MMDFKFRVTETYGTTHKECTLSTSDSDSISRLRQHLSFGFRDDIRGVYAPIASQLDEVPFPRRVTKDTIDRKDSAVDVDM